MCRSHNAPNADGHAWVDARVCARASRVRRCCFQLTYLSVLDVPLNIASTISHIIQESSSFVQAERKMPRSAPQPPRAESVLNLDLSMYLACSTYACGVATLVSAKPTPRAPTRKKCAFRLGALLRRARRSVLLFRESFFRVPRSLLVCVMASRV